LDTQFHPSTLHISTDFQDEDPRAQRLVHETHKVLLGDYNVSEEKLGEALRCGLHEPLTGLYRIKYVELCAKYFEPKVVVSFFADLNFAFVCFFDIRDVGKTKLTNCLNFTFFNQRNCLMA
jgi:hypothetical protein